jgi:hypothetical protein
VVSSWEFGIEPSGSIKNWELSSDLTTGVVNHVLWASFKCIPWSME